MNKKEFDKKYVENIVVHCPNIDKDTEFCKQAEEHGYKLSSGRSFVVYNIWNAYRKKTCYNLSEGTYGRKDTYENLRKKIIVFEGE